MNNPVNMEDQSRYFGLPWLEKFNKAINGALLAVTTLFVASKVATAPPFIRDIAFSQNRSSTKTETKSETISQPAVKKRRIPQIVYRVWGPDLKNPLMHYSGPWGRSWTPVDPSSLINYRNLAGLPGGSCGAVNTGRFVSVGIVLDMTGVTKRSAVPLDGNIGGLEEWIFPAPELQIKLIGVYGVNPEF